MQAEVLTFQKGSLRSPDSASSIFLWLASGASLERVQQAALLMELSGSLRQLKIGSIAP